ncbi:Mammalian cell entry related domain protein [Segniliparus rotundus DSM 44985]|uniref:Mammalian cell entry related domain protein n=1 Tax=Segniliparus rotundus (strain ATCC BAA-972 / CDC 1076 / CIP 108378 / DSM 44985 / JCM 13578) TaxID=640132 RepID=D6Z971_SEGRD|nr:MlaD family protein [Segniliparus rotundus]ADG98501.1 Mammalian cell entry related domain protein [Segniliparus rotundus DSM 44985]
MTRVMRSLLILVLGLSLGACSALNSLDPAKIPVPGNHIVGGYQIKAVFKSVLNLPDRAKVVSNGVRVGYLESVSLDPDTGHVTTTLRLMQGAQIPVNASVQIRQSTLFGDTFLSVISPPGDTSGLLREGSVIDIEHTMSGDQVEDVLQGISDLVTGGSIQDIYRLQTNAFHQFPQDPDELARQRDALLSTLADLAHNTSALDGLLRKLLDITTNLGDHRQDLNKLALNGPQRLFGLRAVIDEVTKFFIALSYPAEGLGDTFIPYARDFNDMIGAGKIFTRELSRFDLTFPYNLDRLKGFFAYYLLPYWMGGEENIEIERYVPDGDQQGATGPIADNIINSLRLLGVLR